MPFRSGFVSILCRPNAGKSTLLNALVGEKLAIVSPKPQTTRNRILGIVNLPKQKRQPGAQIVLIDTPGIHRPDSSLGRKMMAEVREALEACDLVVVIIDAARERDAADRFLLDMVHKAKTPALLLLNKIDLLRERKKTGRAEATPRGKQQLLPLIERYQGQGFLDIIPLSALKRQGLDILINKIVEHLPAGSPYFPPEQ